jgi:signal transduction histidine kinase
MPRLYLNEFLQSIKSLRDTGTRGVDEEYLLRRIRLVNSLSLAIVSLILFIGLLFYMLTSRLSILIPATLEFFLAMSPLFLNRKNKYVAAALVTYLTQCIASLYFGMLLGNVVELQAVVFFLLLITFMLFDDSILRRVCFVIALIILITLEANYFFQFVQPLSLTRQYSIIFKTLSFFGLFCLIVIVATPYIKNNDSSFKLKRSLKNEEDQNLAKSIFIRNVTHEIQGSFLGIIKMSQSLKVGIERHQDIGAEADQLVDACHTYKCMLANLLEYTKMDAGVFDTVTESSIDIRSFTGKIIRLHMYAAAEKKVTIHLAVSDKVPQLLRGDEIRLIQVFNNLLTNAVKFTRHHSNVYVSIDSVDRGWQLSVRDEGEGISEDKQRSIFDLFVTERSPKNNPEGMGLGLFITKHLVEDVLKGHIIVTTQPGAGACFQLFFPFNHH